MPPDSQPRASGHLTDVSSSRSDTAEAPRRDRHFITQASRPAREITTLLIDDEPLSREALARTLRDNGLSVLGQASGGERALELVLALTPDVVVVDVHLPGISGIQTIEQISLHAPDSRILVLTHSERNKVIEAIVAGASGYILKTAPAESIVRAIRDTAAGECVLSPQVAGRILQRLRELHIPISHPSQAKAREIRAALTDREQQIFAMLATGKSNHQIGADLGLSANTVSNHIKSILTKLHLHNRIEAAACAVRAGMS